MECLLTTGKGNSVKTVWYYVPTSSLRKPYSLDEDGELCHSTSLIVSRTTLETFEVLDEEK